MTSPAANIRYTESLESIGPEQLAGFFVGWPNPPTPQSHLELLQESDAIGLAIDEDTGRVVGYVTALTDHRWTLFVNFLEVLPDYQHRGIGTELVQRLFNRFPDVYSIALQCDAELQSFYQRFGPSRPRAWACGVTTFKPADGREMNGDAGTAGVDGGFDGESPGGGRVWGITGQRPGLRGRSCPVTVSGYLYAVGPNVLATFVTTTTYGTWLPGDLRGYVHDGVILPPQPLLLAHAKTLLAQEPVYFTDVQQIVVFHTLLAATKEYGYTLTDASVEPWHLHWIVAHGYDSVPTMVGRLKNRMRQALRHGRVWTAGYCHRCMYMPDEVATCRQYIARHAGARMIDGQRIQLPAAPGSAG